MNETILGVSKTIIDYLEVPNYLYVKSKALIEGNREYHSEEQYWRDLLGSTFYKNNLKNPRLFSDDVITLRNFQLSQWYPRIPGLYWTFEGVRLRRLSERNINKSPVLGMHYRPFDKRQMMRGGMGTLRTHERNKLKLYGATTSGNLNAAIPVLISRNVSKNILHFTKHNPLVEVDLQGVIRPIPLSYENTFWIEHIPKLCLCVNSILNVKKYISDFPISASAWTIYHNPKGKNEKQYGYTYASFNPIDESSLVEATDWINNYIFEYTKGKGIPLTDYDEETPRFTTAVLSIKDVMDGNVNLKNLNSFFKGIDFRSQNPIKNF